MLILIGILMFILVVASTWWFGFWSNLITLINLLLAAMLASSIYEPVAEKLASFNASFKLLFDFVAVWLVFAVAFFVLRGITDTLSAYRLKFDPITEIVGRSVLSVWIAGVFICFTFFTLQMAPLKPSVYRSATEKSQMGTLPDKMWLAFIQSRSRGALSASKAQSIFDAYKLTPHPDDAADDIRVFDPYANFLPYYNQKRQEIADREVLRVGGVAAK
jgi:hypothetical protein